MKMIVIGNVMMTNLMTRMNQAPNRRWTQTNQMKSSTGRQTRNNISMSLQLCRPSNDIYFRSQFRNKTIPEEKVHLPSASALLATTTPGLVFNNPFKLEENAKIASLEKHVKMVCISAVFIGKMQ